MVFWGSPLYPRAFSIQEGTGFLSTAGRHEENGGSRADRRRFGLPFTVGEDI